MKTHNSKIYRQKNSLMCWLKKLKPKRGRAGEFLGKLSNGLMIPVAVLPIAGLFLGIGSAIANSTEIMEPLKENNPESYIILFGFATFITNSGSFVFSNLAVLFAIAIAIAFTRDAGVAGFSAFVAWLSFNGLQSAMISQENPPAPEIANYTVNNGGFSALSSNINIADVYGWFANFGYTHDPIPSNPGELEEFVKTVPINIVDKINSASNNTSDPNYLTAQEILKLGSFNPVIPEVNPTYRMLYWRNLQESIFTSNLGINSLQSSVFGGLIVGALVAWIYSKTYQIRMPKILGFFSGTRFVPIACILTMMPLSVVFAMVWPGIGLGLSYVGIGLGTMGANGGANALIYGYIFRTLVPFGIHHAFNFPLSYTSVGGDMTNAASIVPLIRTNGQVYAVVQANNIRFGYGVGETLPTWRNVIEALNTNYNFAQNTNAWGGDQTLWFTVRNLLVGKPLILSGNGGEYVINFRTFASNTFNELPAITFNNVTLVTGARSQWDALVASGSVDYSSDLFSAAFPSVNYAQYNQGNYPFMIFGLPAAGVAMIMAAPKQNRKQASSIVGSAILTSFLTGITEPLEFTFLFLAPWLYYGIHAVLCAISFWLMSLLGANVGQTFSGGIIDLSLYGFLPDGLGLKVNSYWVIVIGLFYIPIYFFLFYFLIKRFNLATPGRGGSLKTKKDYLAMKNAKSVAGKLTPIQITAYNLINAFGGKENITAVNACITKLRVSIKDSNVVNEQEIKNLGAQGIMKPSPILLHALFGTDSEPIKTQMNNIINNVVDIKSLEKFINEQNDLKNPAVIEDKIADLKNKSVGISLPKEITVLAPVSGTVKPLSEVNDKTFSDKIVGDGIAILPSDGKIIYPGKQSGKVDVAFPTGHAYVVDVDGAKVMIHIGLETVGLNPDTSDASKLIAFSPHVKTTDKIDKGQVLVDVDFNAIKAKNLNTITPVIVMTESLKYYDVSVIPQLNSEVKTAEPLLKLTLKIK